MLIELRPYKVPLMGQASFQASVMSSQSARRSYGRRNVKDFGLTHQSQDTVRRGSNLKRSLCSMSYFILKYGVRVSCIGLALKAMTLDLRCMARICSQPFAARLRITATRKEEFLGAWACFS